MIDRRMTPDEDTYVALFKACALVGDVKTAFDGIVVNFWMI